MEKTIPKLPPKWVHKTPRLLMADAYTAGSNEFESQDCRDKSTYYMTYRKELHTIKGGPYVKGDNRMLFVGSIRTTEEIFREPVTHEEIDQTKEYLEKFKVTTVGLKPYTFPEQLWRDIVDKNEGRIPVLVEGFREGSVVYPGEPVMQFTSQWPGFGIMAAYFEEEYLHCWAPSERLTQSEHWLQRLKAKVRKVDPHMTEDEVHMAASSMLTDFGARAAIHSTETEILGMYSLITFPGTDSLQGGYQAFMNSNKTPGLSLSVKALAHRNIQGFDEEKDAHRAIYDAAEVGDINSDVADCYDFFKSVEFNLLPLALESRDTGRNIVVTGRPDSGNALQQVLWLCNLAVKNGLFYEKEIDGKKWKCGTWLRFIEGDGMTFEAMDEIIDALIDAGFIFWEWGLFGQGGGQRNNLKRDNFSAKFALCARGFDDKPVVKLSETIGKTTFPGPFKVLRTPEALASKKTIVHISEPGETSLVIYHDGLNLANPFGPGQWDTFLDIKTLVRTKFDTMPLNLDTTHGGPASDLILKMRADLIKKYAPERDLANY